MMENLMKESDKIFDAMRVDGKGGIKLSKAKTDATDGVKDKETARERLAANTAAIDKLQHKLYAESKTALLVVFQAMDTAGKDGVIRKVFGPANPQGVRVESFKRPTEEELAHDYLWRIHMRTPAKGMIGVFNRSHYEDVLVHKVHKLIPEKELDRRYDQLNDFETHLSRNDTVILKFFLHISRDEQKERLQVRLDNPDKQWKFRLGDLKERELWDDYMDAYQAVLDKCSAKHAPWYVIPADKKWYRDWAVSSIILRTLKAIGPEIPQPEENLEGVKII
jgi:PPK2 family polyphosphate:nucleotide phosphotransferase